MRMVFFDGALMDLLRMLTSHSMVFCGAAVQNTYHGPHSVETAVASAVLQFNSGAHAALNVLQGMDIQSSSIASRAASKRNCERLASAAAKETALAKRICRSTRLYCKANKGQLQEQEGVT